MGFVPRGSFVALVTPFDLQGRVDQKTLEHLVVWQMEQGTDGILCCGTTGEGIALSESEKTKVAAICLASTKGKIPVIVNTGNANTRQSVRFTEKMLKLGANACLVVAPYYNRPTQRGCVLHFSEIAKVGLPVIIYNNPGRTLKLEAETIAEISQLPGIVGYKDSTGDLPFIKKVRELCNIPILSGDDHLNYETIREGGVGAISVIGNVIPGPWKQMIACALEKQWDASQAIVDRYAQLCEALFLETNPQCVKFAMSRMGLCRPALRLPLVLPEVSVQQKIEEEIKFLQKKLAAAGADFVVREDEHLV